MIRKIYDFFASLSLSLWLTFGVMFFLGVGSFWPESGSMNDMPLFVWLVEAPVSLSWWLWIVLLLLTVLAANTVICGIESIRTRWGKGGMLQMLSPQFMHLGFLLIVLAHLQSAFGSFKQGIEAREGTRISFPGGNVVEVLKISAAVGKWGMVTDFGADVRSLTGSRSGVVKPNRPVFFEDLGLYLKHVEPGPYPVAYFEVHREPGAGLALAGALLFTMGNLVLLAIRRGRREQ